jgi:hypothetical protein
MGGKDDLPKFPMIFYLNSMVIRGQENPAVARTLMTPKMRPFFDLMVR